MFTEYVTEDNMSDTKRINAFLKLIIVKKKDDISCYSNDMQYLILVLRNTSSVSTG